MVKILACDIAREGFTHHGQHLNATEKSKMAQLIAQYLIKSTNMNNMDPDTF